MTTAAKTVDRHDRHDVVLVKMRRGSKLTYIVWPFIATRVGLSSFKCRARALSLSFSPPPIRASFTYFAEGSMSRVHPSLL